MTTAPLKTCKGLWFPISELHDKYRQSLMLYSPKLIDLDFNPQGVSNGYWQDGQGWVTTGWDSNSDVPVKIILREEDVTHFFYIESPYCSDNEIRIEVRTPCLDDYEKYSAEWVRQLAIDKKATYLKHHDCSLCSAPVGYMINLNQDTVMWNGNCNCGGWDDVRPENWETIALFLKNQSSDVIRDRILEGLS